MVAWSCGPWLPRFLPRAGQLDRVAEGPAENTAHHVVRHQVKDYAAWRAVFDNAEDLRRHYGHLGAEVFTAPGNKNEVFVIDRFPTLEAAQGFAGDSTLREDMGRAGVTAAPRIEFAVEA